jgi:hypothetical protein
MQQKDDMPVLEGVLRRKKNEHGMFEDPWKQRIMCKLSNGVLEAVAVQDGKTSSEKWEGTFDLNKDWYLPPDRRVGGRCVCVCVCLCVRGACVYVCSVCVCACVVCV